jgi:hypothetical protein
MRFDGPERKKKVKVERSQGDPACESEKQKTDREEQKFGDGNLFEALDHVLIYLFSK